MSQQVPFDSNGVPLENNMMAANYGAPETSGQPQYLGGTGGGYVPPAQGPQVHSQRKTSMIDTVESTKLAPQVMILKVLSGIKRHWKWSLPLGLVLGLLAAGGLYLLNPIRYNATATVLIRSSIPRILTEDRQLGRYGQFVNTQIQTILSPDVLDVALQRSEVAKLPIILKQNNRREWLKKQLKVSTSKGSEILNISIETEDGVASETIVNAVLDTYLDYVSDQSQSSNRILLRDLQAEKNRQSTSAKQLQTTIRDKTIQAALRGASSGDRGPSVGLDSGESLKRDVALAEAQLTTLRAMRIASLERIEKPGDLPMSLLVQVDPELAQLSARMEAIVSQREQTAQAIRSPETNRRIQQFDRQIKELDDKIKAIASDTDERKKEEISRLFQSREEINLFEIEQRIREQEIMVDTLQKKYTEQLQLSAERARDILDVGFDTAQLERTNRTLGQIEDRLLTTSSDQLAPAQISALSKAVVGSPMWQLQLSVVGGGTLVFLFLPLLLSVVIEVLKPRLYHVSQVRRSVPHVLIGEIMEPPVSWIHGATFRKRLARYRESVHNWCTHLLLSDPFRSCRTLAVASVAGDDGKTFLAVQIATAMAQMKAGNVLLIDGDMRVGRLHLLFGNEEAGIGLADVLSFRNGFGEAMVQNEREPNLHLLSAGQLDVSPYELLGDGRFRELLDMLEQNYAMILVVLPPVSNAAESLIMASSTDSTLLCVRQRETVLAAMEDVYRKLVNTGASVDGIVVKDIPYYQMASKDGGFADKLEQIRLSHLLQYAE